jgi:AraC family transcriptional regulator
MQGPDRLEWKALETVHACARAEVRLASAASSWDALAASRFLLGQVDVNLPPLTVPAFGVNYGQAFHLERTLHGHRVRGVVAPGRLAILPPDAATRWQFDKAGDVVVVYFSREVFNRAVEEGADRDARSVEIIPRFLIRDLVLERIAHQLLGDIIRPDAISRLRVETRAQELAAHLLGAHSSLGWSLDAEPRAMAPSKLRRAKDFIHANLAAETSLGDIAAAAEMSLFHFARQFRKATGRSPHQYVTEQRLLQARTLLHDQSLPIGVIAQHVGFTHSHFTQMFTRHVGMTPSTFRAILQS